MTTTRATKRQGYLSGWCGTGNHGVCQARYAKSDCRCWCHLPVAVRHCNTCTCEATR